MDLHEISVQLQAGKAKIVKTLVQQAIDEGIPAQTILEEGLLDGMNVIGEKFKNNEVFVPEVLVAARAMNMGVSILKPLLMDADVKAKGRVCIGTVKGDLHDIGKNLVKMMMEGKGLEVIDLGTDVAPETYVRTAIEENCQIICCSALLTTTMGVMADVVKAAEEAGIRDKVKIMIGGAPVTEAFCQQVGADAYKPGLERIRDFCHYLGDPQKDYLTIHVAGTNGKGSVSHMLASVLQHAGYRVGLFTSPHLRDFRERMRVNGKMITEREVVDFVARHKAKMRELDLSFFEMTTAMAFDYFAYSDVEVAVIETGLGGRLDATNVITPLVSIITNVGFDHTDLLGNTLREIASEKAGIIKKSVPVIIGESSEEYNDVFEAKAAVGRSRVIYAEDSFRYIKHRVEGSKQHIALERMCDGRRYDLELDLAGEYQRKNAVTAAAAVHYLHDSSPLTISRRAFIEGFAKAASSTGLAGRWQTLGEKPWIVCDTGHNAHGISYVASMLKDAAQRYNRQIIVIGFAPPLK